MMQKSHIRRIWRGVGLTALLASLAVAAQPPTAPFPVVDSTTQRVRDQDRQRILLAELAAEQHALAEAQRRGAVLRASSPPGNQLTGAQASVVTHQRNIAAIHSELARLLASRRTENFSVKAEPVILRRSDSEISPTVAPPAAPATPAAPWWDVYARDRAPRPRR